MATPNPAIVTISFLNGKLVPKPDPVLVNPGDTVVWTLAPGLSWPNGFTPAAIISYTNREGYVVLVYPDTLAFGDVVSPSTAKSIRGQVRSSAVGGSEQIYTIYASETGHQDVILSTHSDDIDSVDPKIRTNPTMP